MLTGYPQLLLEGSENEPACRELARVLFRLARSGCESPIAGIDDTTHRGDFNVARILACLSSSGEAQAEQLRDCLPDAAFRDVVVRRYKDFALLMSHKASESHRYDPIGLHRLVLLRLAKRQRNLVILYRHRMRESLQRLIALYPDLEELRIMVERLVDRVSREVEMLFDPENSLDRDGSVLELMWKERGAALYFDAERNDWVEQGDDGRTERHAWEFFSQRIEGIRSFHERDCGGVPSFCRGCNDWIDSSS